MTHATGTGGLSSLGLLTPVVLTDLGCWVTASRTCVLLDVEGSATAASAQSVRLVVALSETGSSLGHLELGTWGCRGVVVGFNRSFEGIDGGRT